MPYFAFVDTNAVLVKKIDKSYMKIKGRLYTREVFFCFPEENRIKFYGIYLQTAKIVI